MDERPEPKSRGLDDFDEGMKRLTQARTFLVAMGHDRDDNHARAEALQEDNARLREDIWWLLHGGLDEAGTKLILGQDRGVIRAKLNEIRTALNTDKENGNAEN